MLGNISIFLITAITIILWLFAKVESNFKHETPFELISELLALVGLTMMAFSLMLSSKVEILEDYFGGQDKIYNLHKVLGGIGFLALFTHPIFLVLNKSYDYLYILKYYIPWTNIPYDFGIASLYLFLFGFYIMVFKKLKYATWLKFHNLFILAFLFGGIHALLADSDTKNYFPLRYWATMLIVLGTLCGIYSSFLFRKFGPKYTYIIQTINHKLDTININMVPLGKKMKFQTGQFIYICFNNKTIGDELHPFTISSAVDEDTLRISVKSLGDFTSQLTNLHIKETAYVYGPYGRFGEIYQENKKKMIWIGGGIGITPFLSMLHTEAISPKPGEIIFYYNYLKQSDGVYNDEITALLTYTPRIKYTQWCT
ncbi:MAG: ferric reductase-like transmembrane domain-containing protein, partial [bacterium]|nr:ferric reductase-like transmembrane domain-containing protein [bacterium]